MTIIAPQDQQRAGQRRFLFVPGEVDLQGSNADPPHIPQKLEGYFQYIENER